jgi:hypothetical protein
MAMRVNRFLSPSMTRPATQPYPCASRVMGCSAPGQRERANANRSSRKAVPVRGAATVARPELSAIYKRGFAKPKRTRDRAAPIGTLARPTQPAISKRVCASWWAAATAPTARKTVIAEVATATPPRYVSGHSPQALVRNRSSTNASAEPRRSAHEHRFAVAQNCGRKSQIEWVGTACRPVLIPRHRFLGRRRPRGQPRADRGGAAAMRSAPNQRGFDRGGQNCQRLRRYALARLAAAGPTLASRTPGIIRRGVSTANQRVAHRERQLLQGTIFVRASRASFVAGGKSPCCT